MKQLGEFLTANADAIAAEIMAEWTDVGGREPWHRVPPNLDHDHLPQLIQKLASTALLTFFDPQERAALTWIAVAHGQHRFQWGLSEEILAREYVLLRWALWQRLKRQAPTESASQGIIRLDSALSLAHGASLRGFHRRIIEASGDWPAAVERYLAEWSFTS